MNTPVGGTLALIVHSINLSHAACTQLGLNSVGLSFLPIMRSPEWGYVRLPMKVSQRDGGVGYTKGKSATPPPPYPHRRAGLPWVGLFFQRGQSCLRLTRQGRRQGFRVKGKLIMEIPVKEGGIDEKIYKDREGNKVMTKKMRACSWTLFCLVSVCVSASALMASLLSSSLRWQHSTPLPEARAGYAAGVLHGKLVIAGGTYWEGEKGNWTQKIFSARTHIFDPIGQSWKRLPDAPSPFGYAASTVVDNKLYVLGGYTGKDVNRRLCCNFGLWRLVG